MNTARKDNQKEKELTELESLYVEHSSLLQMHNSIIIKPLKTVHPAKAEVERAEQQLGDIPKKLETLKARIDILEKKYDIKPDATSPSARQRFTP